MSSYAATIHGTLAAFALALCLPAPGFAQAIASSSDAASPIGIDNFARVNATYYRGAEPAADDYDDLAALGIRTVIDLRGDDGDPDAKRLAETFGLRYLAIPMSTRVPPTPLQIDTFLRAVNDPGHQPIYVHCVGGRHRTGVMTAVYRMTHDNWDADQAFAEMKRYRYGPTFLHPEFKRFIYAFKPAATGVTARP